MRELTRPSARGLRVMVSPDGRGSALGNPFVGRLNAGLAARVHRVEAFNRRRAVVDRWDVVHVHFPEHLVRFSGRTSTAAADVVKVLAVLSLARVRGARLVWTAHDLGPHENHRPWLWSLYRRVFMRLVDRTITLDAGALPALSTAYAGFGRTPVDVVPHGHYRDDYPSPPPRRSARKELGLPQDARVVLLMGLIRRYKNVPEAVEQFLASGTTAHLVVAGEANVDPGLADVVRRAAAGDPRVHLRLEKVSEADISLLHAACDVVMLPYSPGTALNSGAAVLAASMSRLVVVRDTAVMRGLADRVGHSWVVPFTGSVGAAVEAATTCDVPAEAETPDLADLEWNQVIDKTLRTYGAARTSVRSRRRKGRGAQ